MNWRHIPLFIFATLATYVLHEAAHWGAGKALGYDMWVNINSAGLAEGRYQKEWHAQFVSAAGPLITLAQAIIGFVLVLKIKSVSAFAFLFAALIMRMTAMAVSLSNPNDEARVSEWLGLGPWALFVLVIAILLVMTIKAGSKLKFGWRAYLLAYICVSAAITAVVLGEPYLPRLNL